MQLKTETTVGIFVLTALILFFFMSTRLGVINLNKKNYNNYYIYFSDVNGLSKKADVKIAGVKVGWIENIELSDENKVCVQIMVAREFCIKDDAQAIIKQDGVLASRFVEIFPGCCNQQLQCGKFFPQMGKQPINYDDLITKFAELSADIQKITTSLVRVVDSNEQGIKEVLEQFKTVLIQVQEQLAPIKNISQDAQSSFAKLSSITQKIDEGKGLIGKILNEDEMYEDVKCTTQNVKNFLSKLNDFSFVLDAHLESLFGIKDKYNNNKGYFNALLFPTKNYFFLGGATINQNGYAKRKIIDQEFFDQNCHKIEEDNLIARTCQTKLSADSWKVNLQFGKIFGNAIVRLGMFEGTLGAAFDYNIPFDKNEVWWLTSFEVFDFAGRNNFSKDKRPHLKWLNRLFLTKNLYFVFGADDVINNNKSWFLGAGLAFAGEDFKHLFVANHN